MDDELGYINLEGLKGAAKDMFAAKIEERVQAWLAEAKQKTEALVSTQKETISKLALQLLAQEIVYEDELQLLF